MFSTYFLWLSHIVLVSVCFNLFVLFSCALLLLYVLVGFVFWLHVCYLPHMQLSRQHYSTPQLNLKFFLP